MQRLFEVDSLRGIAVLAMVAFHALFDLNLFAGYSFALDSGAFLALGRFAAVAFVFLAGISLTLSHSRAKKQKTPSQLAKKFLLRGLKVFSLGLLITLFTWIAFPQNAILFGALHLIGFSTILAIPLIAKKRSSLFLGTAVIAAGLFLESVSWPFPWLLWLGFKPYLFQTFDYFPLLPWFGVALLGIFAGNTLYPEGMRRHEIRDLSANPLIRALSFLGRHSLLIYFLHQPLLVAAVLALA